MNCKLPPPGAEQLQQDQAPRPPAPPMPLAKDTSRYRPSSDDDAFPQRTVTTLGWVVAANGEREGRDHSAKGLGFFPGEKERWVRGAGRGVGGVFTLGGGDCEKSRSRRHVLS